MQLTPAVTDGVRKFIRLTALMSNPQYFKRIRDEFDLIEALEVATIYFHQTERVMGKKLYKGTPFDVIEDVKRATEEHFLSGREQHDVALARGKNLTMYHLAVVPFIEMFKDIEHEQILKTVDAALEQTKQLIYTMDVQSHYDDALVTLAQVGAMIKEREAARKIELAKKRRGKRRKKKDNLTDWIEKKESEGSRSF
jgi:ribosomal protein L21